MTAPAEFLEKARKRLVDVSMRNRLLNYVGGKRSLAVEIVDEQPTALWQLLVTKARKLTLRGRDPDETEEGDKAAEPDDAAPDTDGGAILDALGKAHLDDFIDTRFPKDVLSARLRKLDDARRTADEEQGVATLFVALGFLHYFETESSEKERKAPLVLVPAKLIRTGRDSWQVMAGDDDPIVNPGLVEYLPAHSIALPDFSSSDAAEVDIVGWFAAVQKLASSQKRWRVSATCLIGNFSFQKFVMHEDLKRNGALVGQHPLVEQLARRQGQSAGFSELPPEIRALDLDQGFAPENTFQVVDADATQQRALAAVATGKSLVIQGPPGTGKSQTITNLISRALADGKSVLFVAEKQAALNVVYDRLRKAGLGDFCLELHSTKANKKVLVNEVKRAWDLCAVPLPKPAAGTDDLKKVRDQLTAYAEALHTPVNPLGLTPYQVIGRLLSLHAVADVRLSIDVSKVDRPGLRLAREALTALADAAAQLGCPPAEHPWAGASLDAFTLEKRERFGDVLAQLRELLRRVENQAALAQSQFGVALRPLAEAAGVYQQVAQVLRTSPGVPRSVLGAPDWAGFAAGAEDALGRLEAFKARDAQSAGRVVSESGLGELSADVQLVVARADSIWAWFSGAWRAARRRLKAVIPASGWEGPMAAARAISERLAVRHEREALARDEGAKHFFGDQWRGADSDSQRLAERLAWCRAFHLSAASLGLGSVVFAVAERPAPDVEALDALAQQCSEAAKLFAELQALIWSPRDHLKNPEIAKLLPVLEELASMPEGWREMQAFQHAQEAVRATSASLLADAASTGSVPWKGLPDVFERRFLRLWLDAVEAARPALGRFDGHGHAMRIEEFRKLDRAVLEKNRERMIAGLRERAQRVLAEAKEATKVMRDQSSRMRGHMAPRQFVQKAFTGLRALKPCFLMSPMAVAQALPIDQQFDLVVFDEASQLTVEDSLGAVARGRQLVVVGDPRQLPPTNFFAVQLGETETETGDDGELKLEALESVLELAQAAGFFGAQLKWHYRSRHESLIAFSNRNFYEASLLTFPSADRAVGEVGLSFEFVAGTYEGKGVNSAEASKVVDAVVEHARNAPDRSLGVGTFSVAQQQRILDLLDDRRRDVPELDAFLTVDKLEPFFVKNLESIQGDERDVIFLSVTYGPAADGRIRYNFGPINGEAGWRRLNVLTTRARQQMRVFSSMRPDDMRFEPGLRGASLLRDFLAYAEKGVLLGAAASVSADVESPFEQEVASALREAEIDLVSQVGVAGYRVDFGVADEQARGRFVCGIECDGATYHSAESARDRDRLREEVLRGLGWDLHRVWSTDWWHHREREVKRLLGLIEGSRQKARQATPTRRSGANTPSAANPVAPVPPPAASSRVQRRPLQVPPFGPYRVVSLPPQLGALLEAQSSVIIKLVIQLLEAEGPVHDELVRDRLMDAFGHSRTGARIAARLDRELVALNGLHGVVREEPFWRMGHLGVVPRNRAGVSGLPSAIALEEYRVGVVDALRLNLRLTEEELVAVLRDAFGFGAATADFRAGLSKALGRMRALREIVESSEGFALATS